MTDSFVYITRSRKKYSNTRVCLVQLTIYMSMMIILNMCACECTMYSDNYDMVHLTKDEWNVIIDRPT